MAAWWALVMWYTLHVVVKIVEMYRRCFRFVESKFPRSDWNSGKSPGVVAIVVDGDSARNDKDMIAKLLVWLAGAGIRQVSLYDMEGILKTSGTYLKEKVTSAHWRRKNDLVQCSNGMTTGEKQGLSSYTNEKAQEMTIELVSMHEGRAALAEAAQRAYEDLKTLPVPEQEQKLQQLSEKDVNRYLSEIGQWRPDPELMLVFGSMNCVQGFPPWRLRLTEIVFLGALRNLRYSSFVAALRSFSGKTQRYGK